MLEYCAGLVVFSLLFSSKYALSWVLIHKKKVALSLVVIITSELSILYLIYISIDKYKLNGIKIVIGFLAASVLGLLFYMVQKNTKSRS